MFRIDFNHCSKGAGRFRTHVATIEEDSVFKFNYTLSRDGYIIVQNRGNRLLLDTGAPFSFGEKLAGIPGVTGAPPKDVGGFTPQKLSSAMDCHVDGVIGAETLQSRTIHINPVSQKVSFSSTRIGSGQAVSIKDKMNVPIVDVAFDGHVMPTIFDTGAPLGYVPRSMIVGREPQGEFDDFYPLWGAFSTGVYNIPVKIGDWQDVIPFGIFPREIEQVHSRNDCPTIIGLGLLKNHQITLGLREGLMKLEPLE